jgi:hypothetical protein
MQQKTRDATAWRSASTRFRPATRMEEPLSKEILYRFQEVVGRSSDEFAEFGLER